jgi:hypothetical protein
MDKQEQLYKKAKSHFREGGFHNDDFAVYAIQLFNALYPGQHHQPDHAVRYSAFENALSDWFKESRPYNSQKLKEDISKRVNPDGWKKYHVIFGVPVKVKGRAKFPFAKSLTVDGVTFHRKSWGYVQSVDNGAFEKELLETYKNERYTGQQAARILFHQLYFEAEVYAPREIIAVNMVHDAFSLFTACASISQGRFTTVYYHFSNRVKSRKPILNPHLLYVKGNPTTGTYTSNGIPPEMPDEALEFTNDAGKLRTFKRYMKIVFAEQPTPVEKRIRTLIVEFDKAFQVTDPHLRALSLWRCLEVATRKANNETRKQEDIVNILGSWRADDLWKEQGKLIAGSRNLYIHEGEEFTHETRDYYLVWLQEYVSAALALLMWMKRHNLGKTSAEIDDFFALYPSPKATLEIASKMLRAKKKLES